MNLLRGVLILNSYRLPGQHTNHPSGQPQHRRTLGYSSPQPLLQLQTLIAVTRVLFQHAINCHLLQPKCKLWTLVARHVRHTRKGKMNMLTSKAPLHATRNDGQNLLKPSPGNPGITPSLPSIGNISTTSSQVFATLLISSHRRHGSQRLEVLLDSNLLGLVDSPARAQRQTARASTPS